MANYKHQNAVDWFLGLVQTDSETFHETKVAEHIISEVKKRNWNCEIIRQKIDLKDIPANIRMRVPNADELQGETENLFLVFPATDESKPTIFFSAHMDTVKPGNGCKPQFTEDGLIKTDGTTVLGADDKAGIAEALAGMELVLNENLPHGKVVMIFPAMEEIGLVGSQMSDLSGLGLNYGYVLDMGDRIGTLVTRTLHTQFVTIDLTYEGPKVHGAGAWGENIFSYASEIVRMLPRGLHSEDRYASIGVNNMTFSKDEGYRVSNKATIKVNVASLYEEDMRLYIDIITSMLDHLKRDKLVITYKVSPIPSLGYSIYDFGAKGEEIVAGAEKVLREMGIEPKHDKSRGGFDANEYAKKDVATLVLSCGFMGEHTTKEYIVEQDLHDGAEMVKRLILNA